MIISFNTGKINTNNSGGLLQQKRVEVTENGMDVVVPDAGYDGLSTVYIKTDVGNGGGSFKDFSVIGYDDETSMMLNNEIDDDIAYSKSLYDAWNPENTSANRLYASNQQLVYAPSIDTSNVTDFSEIFNYSKKIKYIPKLNYSKANNLTKAFRYNLISNIDISDATKINSLNSSFESCSFLESVVLPSYMGAVTDMTKAFYGCNSLIEIDFSGKNCHPESFNYCFANCTNLKRIKGLDTSKCNNGSYMFQVCNSLEIVPLVSLKAAIPSPFASSSNWAYPFGNSAIEITKMEGVVDCEHITNWGGSSMDFFYRLTKLETIEQMGTIKGSNFRVNQCTKLSVDSLLVILNALYDYNGNGETVPSTAKATLGSTNLAKLSDEQKAIATNKGWTLA